jgi:hypothetical protein
LSEQLQKENERLEKQFATMENKLCKEALDAGVKEMKLEKRIKELEGDRECIRCHKQFKPELPTLCNSCEYFLNIDLC